MGNSLPDGTEFRALLQLPEEAFISQCVVERTQAGGPGGQHRNRTYTGTRLRHPRFPDLETMAAGHREGGRNLTDAAGQLRSLLALTQRHSPPESLPPLPWKPGHVSTGHPLYPLFLSLALDLLEVHTGHIAEAAQALGWSGSALVRQLHRDKHAWMALQRCRERFGLSALKAPG